MELLVSSALDAFLYHMDHGLGRGENTIVNYGVDLGQFLDFLEQEGVQTPGKLPPGISAPSLGNSWALAMPRPVRLASSLPYGVSSNISAIQR